VYVLYVVVAVLAGALVLFFAGHPAEGYTGGFLWEDTIERPDTFFLVFAICFPAFTGMTAGVGLSGDLAKPSRSIPLGTLAATCLGGIIYVAIIWKLTASASPQMLAEDPLVMSRIALWGPIIPIGLGCATLSSAIGSILVAPRTMQALGKDGGFPIAAMNRATARGAGKSNEPRAATIITAVLALGVAALGDVDAVARLISMFFMLTYGALCTISFLEHFAASPSYRPSFRSRWYISLFGGCMCLLMMFQMDPLFAVFSLAAMIGLYWLSGRSEGNQEGQDLRTIFRGVMYQAIRMMNVFLQRGRVANQSLDWRPSIVSLDARKTTGSRSGLQLLGWLCERHGFGTYLRLVEGDLDEETIRTSKAVRNELVDLCERDYPGLYAGAVISPSRRGALAQTLQLPGAGGMENNTVLFDFDTSDPPEMIDRVVRSALLASAAKKNLLFLRYGERRFGRRANIHVWLTWHDTQNATLMLLLAYILAGHEDWSQAEISVFAAFPQRELGEERERFVGLLEAGRIPISPANVRFHTVEVGEAFRELVEQTSATADLVVMGITLERLREKGPDLLTRHPALAEVLFVLASERVLIE
jgi:hypothetical protein